jgi:hypothetical protein
MLFSVPAKKYNCELQQQKSFNWEINTRRPTFEMEIERERTLANEK